MNLAQRLLLLKLAFAAVGPLLFAPDQEVEARPRKASVTLEEGINRRGNDIARIQYQGRRPFRQHQSQHFTMEEYLYGPGDQSRIWHRPRGERLEPRSDYEDLSPPRGRGRGCYGGVCPNCGW